MTPDRSPRALEAAVRKLERELDAGPFDDVPHPSEIATEPPATRYHPTELGNADRLVDAYAGTLRHVHPWKAWLAWDGTRWRRDERGSNQEAAKAVVRHLFVLAEAAQAKADRLAVEHAETLATARLIGRSKEVMQAREDAKRSDAFRAAEAAADEAAHLRNWAALSSTQRVIGNMAKLACSEPRLVASPSEFDSDIWALNVTNGTLDLRTGELRPHRQADMITKIAGAAYDPDARAPRWEQFLTEIQPEPEMRAWLQRWFGYCLTGSISEQVMLFALGDGSNGKNVLVDTLKMVMGDYAANAAPDLLVLKNNDEHPTGFADLQGHRMVVVSEIDRGRKWAEATIKRLTGDATIKARHMRKDFYEFTATHKFTVMANNKPEIQGTDHGIWRRIRLAPFATLITKPEKGLLATLRGEIDGILAWAIRGCLAWQRDGLGEAATMRKAAADYRDSQNVLGEWIWDRCTCVCDPAAQRWEDGMCLTCGAATELHAVDTKKPEESWQDLYADFREWQERRGITRPWTLPTFRDELLKRRNVTATRTAKWRGARGIRLQRVPGAGFSSRETDERRWR